MLTEADELTEIAVSDHALMLHRSARRGNRSGQRHNDGTGAKNNNRNPSPTPLPTEAGIAPGRAL